MNELYRDGKLLLASYLVVPGDMGSRAGVERYWHRLADFGADHPRELAFLELHHHQPYLDEESRALAAAIDAEAAAFVRRGQRAGELRPGDPMALIALVFGAFLGLVRWQLAKDGRIRRAAIVAHTDAVWALVSLQS